MPALHVQLTALLLTGTVASELREHLQSTLGAAYTIERELGGGGMSRVFVATETALGRQVVVKVLPAEMAGHVSAGRFKREIALAAQLQHPHIVPLLTAGEADGLPFFTMPYIRGESLRARLIQGGELPLADAVRILREIASALAFAHQQGIVHRDIKPDNVLISSGSAMVTDFGVAKALSASTAGDTQASLTAFGVALGTPAYMSPEQASADPNVDHRADIYAWGVVAYELLTGQPPFAARAPQAMLAAHASEHPELITRRRASIPGPLGELVMRCLEKRPADRPQRAEDLVHSLDALATPSGVTQPITARAPTLSERARRRFVAAISIVAVLAAMGGGLLYARAHRGAAVAAATAAEHRIAVMPFVVVGHDASAEPIADGITDELTAALGKVHGLHLAGRQAVFAYHDSTVDPKRAGQRLGVDALLVGTLQRSANRIRVTAQLLDAADGLSTWSGSYDRDAKDMFAVEDSIANAIATELKLTLEGDGQQLVAEGTRDATAHELYLEGMFWSQKETEPALRKGLDLFAQASARDPEYAAPMAGAASAWVALADSWVAPKDAYPKAERAARAALRLDPANAAAHSRLAGVLLFYQWDLDGADGEAQAALRLSPGDAFALGMLANIEFARGRLDSAVRLARRGVQANPISVESIDWLAWAFTQAGLLDSAEATIRKETELDPDFLDTWEMSVPELRARQQRWNDCLGAVANARTRTNMAYMEVWESICLAHSGRIADARRALDALISARAKGYVAGEAIASGFVALGDRDVAFKWLEQAFDDRSAGMTFSLPSWVFDPIRDDARFKALQQRVAAAAGKAP